MLLSGGIADTSDTAYTDDFLDTVISLIPLIIQWYKSIYFILFVFKIQLVEIILHCLI